MRPHESGSKQPLFRKTGGFYSGENKFAARVNAALLLREPSFHPMKISHLAAVVLLSVSAIGSIGSIGLVAQQFTIQRSAVQVLATTVTLERMQGMSDALAHIPEGQRHAAAMEYGVSGDKDIEVALTAMRGDLEASQKARAEELATNDKRLAVLLAACGFNAIVTIMSILALYELAARQSLRASDHAAEKRPDSQSRLIASET
jgi:hypothetical protein